MGICLLIPLLANLVLVASKELSTAKFINKVMLDDNFQLQWNFNKTHILFETKVKTNGYIGFGISKNGNMFPSDVVIGWVIDGKSHFGDRHAVNKKVPLLDTKQDWQLLKAMEDVGYTTLTMVRSLDTCDDEDIAIKMGTSRVIFAYHPKDPSSEDNIPYHGASTRGTKSLLLLDPPSSEREDVQMPDDLFTIDIRQMEYNVPSATTTYACSIHKLPKLTGKHHMIKYEPVIDAGHERLVHHMILYFCKEPIDEAYVNNTYQCYRNPPPGTLESCESVFSAWAIGGQAMVYPKHVGHSLGTDIDPMYFRLETHYDNPGQRSDIVDSSGLRFSLTKQIRKHDAGVLMTGAAVKPTMLIPPYNTDFMSRFYCHQDCLARGMSNLPDHKLHVISDMLHAHLLGRKLRTRIIRNGIELPVLQEDNNYDFDYQEQRLLLEERVLEEGDALIVECEYDSSQRTKVTRGGHDTSQEMCLSFLLYYPRSPLTVCLTEYKYDSYDGKWTDFFGTNWTKNESQVQFREILETSSIYNTCDGDSRFNRTETTTAQLEVNQTYTPPQSVCELSLAPLTSSSSSFLCTLLVLLVRFISSKV